MSSSADNSPVTSTRTPLSGISTSSKSLVSSTSHPPSTSSSASSDTGEGPTSSPASKSASSSTSTSTSASMSLAPTSTSHTPSHIASASSSNTPTSTSTSTASTTMSTTTTTTTTSSPPTSSSTSSKTQSSNTHPTSTPPATTHSTSPPPSTSHSSTTAPTSSSQSVPPSSTHSSTPGPSSPTTPSSTQVSTSTSPSDSPSTTIHSTSPSSTLKSTHFVTTTNSLGETTTSAPGVVTQIVTSTASDGALVTQTSVVANPTLSPNVGPSGSTFFKNTGAVAGVFVLVGLSVAAICLWIFFAIRRRRRTQKLERDSAVSASLAAAGFKRTDLEDDVDFGPHSRVPSADLEMAQRSTSGFGRSDNGDLFDPFAGYPASYGARGGAREGGYLPAAPTSPTLPFLGMNAYLDNEDGGRDRRISGTGHTSAASYEPLLAYATAPSPSLENGDDNRPPTPPPRNPLRILHGSQPGSPSGTPTFDFSKVTPDIRPPDNDRASSEYSNESADHDDRLNPGLMRRARAGSSGDSINDLRDDEDYSRPVLAVRNMTTITDASSSVDSHS